MYKKSIFTKEQLSRLTERLKKEEGKYVKGKLKHVEKAFFDTKQFTYGWGTKAPNPTKKNPIPTITKEQADKALLKAIKRTIKEYRWVEKRCPFPINGVRREAFCDMIFNMGFTAFRKFKQMLKLTFNNNNSDWHFVACEAKYRRGSRKLSPWYKTVKKRAERIVYELDTGDFYVKGS